jgi:3',5'-nucleoside bisphosphate phosphatase
MKSLKGDLHIHTCLSPCAELDMSPLTIVKQSLEKGLDFIAICDHNSAENTGAVLRASSGSGLHVFPGIEISSMEEIHSLAIFDSEIQALNMQDFIYQHLYGKNSPEIFGDQVIVNELDEVEGFNERMLIGSTELRIDEIVEKVHSLGGISIACHVDRPSFSIISQLGFIPPNLALDALEISYRIKPESISSYSEIFKNFPVVTSSDAHSPADIGRACTSFFIETPCVNEIRMAMREEFGRRMGN